tara:strand:+ start:1107 stop:1499 length:393 start_codon:yes stop_codon:yes gene_type:complete
MAHDNFSDIYKEQILELYKDPSNYGSLKNPTHNHTEYNSFCGDEITIHLDVKNKKINDIKFSGSGCVISIVTASLLTDMLKGFNIEDAKKLSGKDILKLLKTKISPARVKCAFLPLEAVKGALDKGVKNA